MWMIESLIESLIAVTAFALLYALLMLANHDTKESRSKPGSRSKPKVRLKKPPIKE